MSRDLLEISEISVSAKPLFASLKIVPSNSALSEYAAVLFEPLRLQLLEWPDKAADADKNVVKIAS